MKFRHVGALVAGAALDAMLGDPPGWPHPVRLIGKQIEYGENLLRDQVLVHVGEEDWPLDRPQTELLAGAALAGGVMACLPSAAWLLMKATERIHPMLAFAVETVVFYQLVAARSLRDESMAVFKPLQAGETEAARAALARIVGRDTDSLDEAGMARATVETIAENASDGVLAPMMYQAIGGMPLALLYKAVNTLDSMVGYKNERYEYLGRASAKIDDVFNVVPARLTGLVMVTAAHLVRYNGERSWEVFKRDRYNHTSPNSAQAEAACAGALEVQLGGPNRYGGVVVDKPTIGDDMRPIEPDDIVRANRLMRVTAALGLAVCACVGFVAGLTGARGR